MTLNKFADKKWIRPHVSSKREISDLFEIVVRDLKDAKSSISSDWRFGIAYNAALKLCMILLYAEGYRSESTSHHMRTIAMLPEILGTERQIDADYLDACRRKRNIVEYDYAGGASNEDANELIEFTKSLKSDVQEWLKLYHQELI